MSTRHPQAGILLPPPSVGRHLEWSLRPGVDAREAAAALAVMVDGTTCVAGLGLSFTRALGLEVDGLRTFPPQVGAGVDVPSTPRALWTWLRGEDRGVVLHRSRALEAALSPFFVLESVVDAFEYDGGRDLSGYQDGTENPQGEEAAAVAIVAEGSLAGSSFVAVQRWIHDFAALDAMGRSGSDEAIGRERDSNEEMDDAPESAHVKRTAQEGFDPPAFVLRRSMPWSDGGRAGLVFVAFGTSFDAYETLLRHMAGLDDGVVDGLFRFTRPLTGFFCWCPPVREGRLVLE